MIQFNDLINVLYKHVFPAVVCLSAPELKTRSAHLLQMRSIKVFFCHMLSWIGSLYTKHTHTHTHTDPMKCCLLHDTIRNILNLHYF